MLCTYDDDDDNNNIHKNLDGKLWLNRHWNCCWLSVWHLFSPKNLFRKIIFESFCLVSTPKAIEASINDKTHFTKSGKKQLKRLSLSRLHAEISVRTVDMQLGVVVKIF